jgi:uncharacterized membrane protein YdjX (TVP38/TMEM64 family)
MEGDNTPSDVLASAGGQTVPTGEEQARPAQRAFLSRKLLVRLLVVLFVIAITATIFIFRDRVTDLQAYGYLGAFLIALITAATIVLPVPGIALIFALGAVYDPVLVGLAAGAGSALGEITGYMAGFSGQVVAENSRMYSRLEQWMRRRGSIVIFILSFVPNPLFDVAGATAGVLRYPLWKFLLVCFLGKTPRNIIVALAGAWALEGMLEFLERYF